MNQRPPIQSTRQSLPFQDPAFGWDTFEDFFCDFLNAQPVITVTDNGNEIRKKVLRARPYGRKGDNQHGIDLIAEMEGGETWEFQCKHYRTWGPQETRDALTAYNRDAPRRFLLVTRDLSEECFQVVADNPHWELWDAREINRRFRELDNKNDAARILFTHFGPGWAEAFFGISGDGPLISAKAKFQQYLRPSIRFHHRHALIGRANFIEGLDDFVRNNAARVFILAGRGGLGKSRLLLHWSENFNQRHPDHTLRFLSDKCMDFGPSLQSSPPLLTLVFDDAHRLDDVRRALFHELPRRTHIKLVLSLRPGPIAQVTQELLAAGFDTTEIVTAETMEPLNPDQAMQLVDAALKPDFLRHRHFLRAASKDCPLIAVIGAELINSGSLAHRDFVNEDEFRQRVFETLLKDADPVRDRFGRQETDEFLRLLALLGPVKLDSAFLTRAYSFLSMRQADHVSHLRDALDSVGLLHTTGAGTRVTPDLLSDHLAYTACYDHTGQSRTFSERLLDSFSPEEFPKVIQRLAEAEWRALGERPDSASVVQPLWKWFCERFEASNFHDRCNQLQEWANIAEIQPQRTIELAELSLRLTTAPSSANDTDALYTRLNWHTHQHSIEWLPRMLATVAENHANRVSRCFDILWQVARHAPKASDWPNGHPITLMGEVISYKIWKGMPVHTAGIEWLERIVCDIAWTEDTKTNVELLGTFAKPIFATSIEENWSSRHAVHMRYHPVHLENTACLRARILSIFRDILGKCNECLASKLVPIIESCCDFARLGYGASPSKEFIEAWDVERLKSLSILEQILRKFDEPFIQYQIRKTLLHHVRYDKGSSDLRVACRNFLISITDSLDLRIARVAFGYDHDEFACPAGRPSWQSRAKARWRTFVSEVARRTHDKYPDAVSWLGHFAHLDSHWRSFEIDSLSPSFRELIVELAEQHPAEGITAAELLLEDAKHPLVRAFGILAHRATKGNHAERTRLVQAAVSADEPLQTAAVECCALWRREGSITEQVWRIIEELGPSASSTVAWGLVNFVGCFNGEGMLRDWHLIASIPFNSNEAGTASHIATGAAELVARQKLHPDSESIARFLGRFEAITDPSGHQMERALAKLADLFPVEMFLMLWRRNQFRKAGNDSLKPLPYHLGRIRFARIMEAPEVSALLIESEQRLAAGRELDPDEMHLLSSVIQHGSENPSAWLEEAANRANTKEHLIALYELGAVTGIKNIPLAYPRFAKALLNRARAIGTDCHDNLFRKLLYVGGGHGTLNGEPDDEWRGLLETIDSAARQHASDPDLGPLFVEMVRHERSWMESTRLRDSAFSEDE